MNWKLHPISEFKNLQAVWQTLNRETNSSPLLDVEFIAPLLKEFSDGKELLACFHQNGKVAAMGILAPKNRGAWETFQPSQAPLGAWIHRPETDLPQLTSSLLKALPGFPLALGITQQDPALVPRPSDNGKLETLDYIQTARISVMGSFDDYWNSRGKNLRQNMKKQRNKLEKDGIATRLQVSTDPREVAAAVADYGRLESAGWKAEGGTAIHPDNAQGRFYLSMLEAFCNKGAGRIYRYWYNDRIAAMDLCIEGGDSLIILKTTYDESISSGTSPALLMRQEAFRQLYDEGRIKRIEFYGKVMDWHTKWSDEIRTMYHINSYRWEVLQRVRRSIVASKAAMAASS